MRSRKQVSEIQIWRTLFDHCSPKVGSFSPKWILFFRARTPTVTENHTFRVKEIFSFSAQMRRSSRIDLRKQTHALLAVRDASDQTRGNRRRWRAELCVAVVRVLSDRKLDLCVNWLFLSALSCCFASSHIDEPLSGDTSHNETQLVSFGPWQQFIVPAGR